MKILIVGGTRFIGKAIVKQALQKGHDVTLFNRGETNHSFQVSHIKGDIKEFVSFKKEIRKQKFDIAIHCIAYTENHAHDLREVFQESNTHIIALSSCDCYEAFQGINRGVDKAELPIKESSQLSQMKYYWSDSEAKGDTANLYDKNLMSDILMEGHKNGEYGLTIFRLPMVYGPEDMQYAGRHGSIIQRILDKQKHFLIGAREQCQVFTYGHVDNIAAAIIHSLNQKVCNGKFYNLGEEYSRSRRRWAELYSQLNNWEFEFHVLPDHLLYNEASIKNAPPMHLIINNDRFLTETGFQPPVTLEEAIKSTFQYAREKPEVLGENPDYQKESELLESYKNAIRAIN